MPRVDHFEDITVSGNISLSATSKILPGLSDIAQLANVRFASGFAGSDAGEQIRQAISDLPSTGGIIIADLEGAQTISSTITVNVTGTTILLGAANYTATATAFTVTAYYL